MNHYRAVYQALVALNPQEEPAVNWKQYFRVLNENDVTPPSRDELGQGTRTDSWIWIVPSPPQFPSTSTPSGNSKPVASTSLVPSRVVSSEEEDIETRNFDRVQWAKAQARAERYEEEVQLTVEEMGRTLRYFTWKRDWWLSLRPEITGFDSSPEVRAGLRAYAHRQSDIYDKLVTLFVNHWRPYLVSCSLGRDWLMEHDSRTCSTPLPSSSARNATSGPTSTTTHIPTPTPNDPEPVDAALMSEDEDEYDEDAGGSLEDFMDIEDMLSDD